MLPLFKAQPLKVGDRFPTTDGKVIEITKEVKWNWPKWVTHEIAYVEKNGLSKWRDFTGGNGFVNQWGVSIIRTQFQYICFSLKEKVLNLRKNLANLIYPN